MWRLAEPHVHPIFSANIFLVLGRDADLVIDSGMGVAPLRPALEACRPAPEKPLWLFTTHAHIDHIGGAHEFERQFVHPLEADEMARPAPYRLQTDNIPERFRAIFRKAGLPELWPLLIDAVPTPDYDIDAYAIQPAPATDLVEDGARIELGDWKAEVLHLPGHAPGQVGLWHADTTTLFSADAIYDGALLYEGAGTDIADYQHTLQRILDLRADQVLGGHGDPIGRARTQEIAQHYLTLWQEMNGQG